MYYYNSSITHRIHGAAIYGNMDPINIPQMLAYIAYMDPMGYILTSILCTIIYHQSIIYVIYTIIHHIPSFITVLL